MENKYKNDVQHFDFSLWALTNSLDGPNPGGGDIGRSRTGAESVPV